MYKMRSLFLFLNVLVALGLLGSNLGGVVASASPLPSGNRAEKSSPAALSSCDPLTRFKKKNFSNPTKIDNKWFPLKPGTQWVLEGRANRGHGVLPHQVIFTVTDLTKVINGVKSVVVFDRDISDGVLVESELAFFAQDDQGNVWNVGEYPEEYENGVLQGAPSTWFTGIDGAQAGVHMLANPQLGTAPYMQGYAPSIDFFDCGRVFRMGKSTCVPFDCYNNVLVIDEWSPLESGAAHQRKLHAPGVGIVQVGAVQDPQGETLVMVRRGRIDIPSRSGGNETLAQVRAMAMELDKRGYWVSPDVYGKTPPVQLSNDSSSSP